MSIPIQAAGLHRSLQLNSMWLNDLAAMAHPTRLAARLDPALSAATLEQLQKRPRLQPRLAELLFDNELHSDGTGLGPDLLRGHDPRRTAILAGSIWHARSLLKLVSKPHLTALIDHIGADAHAFGIRHLAQAIATSLIADPNRLAQQIEHDGHACLGAWLNDSSALERSCVLLRLPVGTAAENPLPEHSKASGQLFALVLAHLDTEHPTK
ncbi:nodulation protein NolU (plasmid) [Rhizobium sp. YTUHZ044]